MTTTLITFIVFLVVALLMGLGVLLRKRTPLKGSCHNTMKRYREGRGEAVEEVPCDDCTCGGGGDTTGGGAGIAGPVIVDDDGDSAGQAPRLLDLAKRRETGENE